VLEAINPLGRVVALIGLLALWAGISRGWQEFRVIGWLCVGALALAAAWTIGRMAYSARIELAKTRVTVGDRAVGRVVVSNAGGRTLVPTRFDLPVGASSATFTVPGLAAGVEHEELFSIPARRRSVLVLGPVRSVKGDPLGILQRVKRWSDPVELFIHPRVVALNAASTGFLRDVEGVTTQNLSSSDVAFHALRDYVPGDDRRSIHWRTTARMGKLMVRQFEETQRSHLLLVLSQRSEDYADPEEFETAISCVASLAAQALREERTVSLFCHDGLIPYPSAVGLFDQLCRIDMRPMTDSLKALVSAAVTAVPQSSVIALAAGAAVSPADLRVAHTQIPLDVKSFAIRACVGTAPARRHIGSLVVLDVADVDELAKAVRTVR
jgi:uncharacterized protein (DUF58 family)